MRKLLFIIVLFFSTSVLADTHENFNSRLAEIYFCETLINTAIVPHQNVDKKSIIANKEDQFESINFVNEKFSFKLNKDFIIFNKEKNNQFNKLEVPITNFSPMIFMFTAQGPFVNITFNKGHFFYTANLGHPYGTRNSYAKCESFE